MIGQLTGIIAAEDADGAVVLDVGGVGYEVLVPLGTLGRLRPTGDAGRVTLFVHTHVREDALLLYAFATREDRTAFRTLIGVSNVGPKMALSLLSAMPARELAAAVGSKDLAKLVAVPGIGKKTAERLLLELKDKLVPEGPSFPPEDGPARPVRPSNAEQLAGALTRLGYRPVEAERTIAQLGARVEAEPLQALLREALALLAR